MGQLIIVKPAGTMGQPLRSEAEGVCEPAKQRRGKVYGKVFQQIAAVGLLTPTESCVSHCDLFAQVSVLMASLRGTRDSRALTQGAARGSLAAVGRTLLTYCGAADGPKVLVLSLSPGLVTTVFGDSLRHPFYEGDTRNLWLSLFNSSLGNPWKTQERKP